MYDAYNITGVLCIARRLINGAAWANPDTEIARLLSEIGEFRLHM